MDASSTLRKHARIVIGVVCALLTALSLVNQRARSAQRNSDSGSGIVTTLTPLSPNTAPFTITIGSAFQWSCQATNRSGSTQTYGLEFFINTPSGKHIQVRPPAGKGPVRNGATLGQKPQATTTSAYSSETGSGFTFECDAAGTSGNILSSATFPFTVQVLPAAVVAPHFTDVATTAGVVMTHHRDSKSCLNLLGTGAAWADYDNSGHPSLFISDYGGASHLFHNNGPSAKPQFTDVTASAFPHDVNPQGQLILPDATGVTFADYDNDGNPDLLVLAFGAPHLFHNNGNGTFTSVDPAKTFLDTSGNPVLWTDMHGMPLRGTSAAWADYDGDGYQDLYLGNYEACFSGQPSVNNLQPSYLFHNNANGTFTLVDSLLGGETNKQVMGMTLGVTWFDFGNGRPDLFVANDYASIIVPSQLWRNDGGSNGVNNWTFTNISTSSGISAALSQIAALGTAVIDFNRDGCPDLMVTSIGPNFLLQNTCSSSGGFTSVGQGAGFWRDGFVNATGTGFTTSIVWGNYAADFNNDGWEDAVLGGGPIGVGPSIPNALLVNNYNSHLTGNSNDTAFLDLTYLANTGNAHSAPTIATADYDGDGKMDFVEVNFSNAAVNLFHNDTPGAGNWLEVKLVGGCLSCTPGSGLSNRDGVGAKLTLVSAGGTQHRQILNGGSLGAGTQLIAHFGLAGDTTVTSLTITWPSGLTQTFSGLSANQRILITEGSSTVRTF